MQEDNTTPALTIGQLARQAGLNVRTLRYYETLGLLTPAARSEGGYRLYSTEDAKQLRFILQAKRVGFRLEEIQRIIDLSRQGGACTYVRETVSQHLVDVEQRLAELQHVRVQLSAMDSAWRTGGDERGDVCGLIEAWGPSATENNEGDIMNTGKRQVELFTAGCPICEPAVELVQRVACPSCEVTVHNVKDSPQAAADAKQLGISRLPMVLVDGKPLECCQIGPITETALRAAGVGAG